MRKIFRAPVFQFTIGFVFVISLVVPALGRATHRQTGVQAQTQMSQDVTISGKVSAVSASTVTVVDDQKAEIVVVLDASTKITKGGKPAKTADIKAEDLVAVVATKGEGDSLVAKSITIS